MTEPRKRPPKGISLDAVDRASENDRRWFEVRPHRSYRIRPFVAGEHPPLKGRGEAYTIVWSVFPGCRIRVPVLLWSGSPVPDEETDEGILAVHVERQLAGNPKLARGLAEAKEAWRLAHSGEALRTDCLAGLSATARLRTEDDARAVLKNWLRGRLLEWPNGVPTLKAPYDRLLGAVCPRVDLDHPLYPEHLVASCVDCGCDLQHPPDDVPDSKICLCCAAGRIREGKADA